MDAEFETLNIHQWEIELRLNLLFHKYDAVIITGENEPFQQQPYVLTALRVLKDFPWLSVELTTTGYKLAENIKNKKTRPLMNVIDVINLSSLGNAVCDEQVMKKKSPSVRQLASYIKHKLNNTLVRVTLLESKWLDYEDFSHLFGNKHIDQITVKHLQGDNIWINANKAHHISDYLYSYYKSAIVRESERFVVYDIADISVFVDKDCQTPSEETYHVMRSDGNIYEGWQTTKPLERRK